MDENRTLPDSQKDIAELREEVQRLSEEQDRLKQQSGNGHRGREQKEEQKGSTQDNDGDEQHNEEEKKKQEAEKAEKRRRRKPYIIAAVVVLLVAGLIWWLHARNFENTDDATVDAHITGLASRVAGIVTAVYVDQNDFVKAGQVLVDLDPRDYQVASDQARGQLLQAQRQAEAEQPNVPLTVLTSQTNILVSRSQVNAAEQGLAAAERNYRAAIQKLRESEANNAKAQSDVERYRPLAEKDEVPREQFDQVLANAKALAATVAANQESAQAAQKQVDQAREQLTQAQQRAQEISQNSPRQISIQKSTLSTREAALVTAQAQLDQAALNLTYCKIMSPVNGIVARRIAEVGQHVTPGQQVLLVTELDDMWVTANFRETQLRHMREGQSVRIHVDALSMDFDGYVEHMPAASGAVMSLLPPENATGNFVKIVQRLPVRIRFKKGQDGLVRLRPGMSVEPNVRIR